jgi:hypothetical protein
MHRVAIAGVILVLIVASMCVVCASVYDQKISYLSQTIKNKPNYYVNQLSNLDSSADKGTHSNFTAQRYGPDSSFDKLSEENFGNAQSVEDYVDNNLSNVDSSGNKGTESNFTAQRYGPDGISDTLTEAATDGGSATFGKTTVGASNFGFTGYLEASRYQCGMTGSVTKISLYLSGGTTGRYARVAIYSDNSGAPNNLLSQSSQQEINSNGWYNFTGFNVAVTNNVYYWLAFQISSSGLQYRYDAGVTNQHAYRAYTYGSFPSSFGSPTYGIEAQSIYASSVGIAYELDLEVQWTNVDFNQATEYLCIYGGTMGAEDIKVDVWNGYSWANLFTDLSTGWNNVTVSSYLTSSTFTIRFKGGSETGDIAQDNWNIDSTLLHVWPADNYKLDLEVQWINVDFSEVNEQLCIYCGVIDSENLKVDVWNGNVWNNVIASLANGWNNVTVSSYLTASTFAIRFKGGTETGDTTRDQWNIDAALLHLWS